MKCDKCQESEATVHEVTIKGGQRHEKHLCESCAKADGVAPQAHVPLPELLKSYITTQTQGAGGTSAVVPAAPATACPACGTTYAQFRTSGLLGCAECYAVFETQLGPLLARAHEGGTHHVGKSPKGPGVTPATPGGDAQRSERVAALRKRLADAVAAEQYEKAAMLRDELARVEAPGPGAPKGGHA